MLYRNIFNSSVVSAALLLFGCGSESSSPAAAKFSPSELQLSYEGTKQFSFSWVDDENAEFYRILEKSDSTSGYVQISGDILAGTEAFSLTASLFNRMNASYILQTCDVNQCLDSDAVFVSADLVHSVGYLKSDVPYSGDYFGSVVSLSEDGSTLAIGADSDNKGKTSNDSNETDSGAVYVFVRENTQWVQQAFLKGSNTEAHDWFGFSLSLSNDGNTLVVGANHEDSASKGVNGTASNNSAPSSGAAYVFKRSNGVWSQQAYLKASNTDEEDRFGQSVAVSGDGLTIAVGADKEGSRATGIDGDESDNTWSGEGAVYVFKATGNSWQQQAYIKAGNRQTVSGKTFGEAVSLSDDGNTLAVGASGESSAAAGIDGDGSDISASFSGAAYVFIREGSTWSQQAYIKASNTYEQDSFAGKLGLSGDGNILAISSELEDGASVGINGDQFNRTATSAGAVYTFVRSGNEWAQEAYIKASNTNQGDYFGSSVSLNHDGSLLAIGAIGEDSSALGVDGHDNFNAFTDSGAVYVFTRTDSNWSQLSYIKSSNTGKHDWFGVSASLSDDGSTLAVGASHEDGSGESSDNNELGGAGAAYLY